MSILKSLRQLASLAAKEVASAAQEAKEAAITTAPRVVGAATEGAPKIADAVREGYRQASRQVSEYVEESRARTEADRPRREALAARKAEQDHQFSIQFRAFGDLEALKYICMTCGQLGVPVQPVRTGTTRVHFGPITASAPTEEALHKCVVCGSLDAIPIASPRGRQLMAQFNHPEPDVEALNQRFASAAREYTRLQEEIDALEAADPYRARTSPVGTDRKREG